MNCLTPLQKRELLALREQKELGRILLPDAPPKKLKRKASSPLRMECPLVPGTPLVPPPRKPRPWELQQVKPQSDVSSRTPSVNPGSSRIDDSPLVSNVRSTPDAMPGPSRIDDSPLVSNVRSALDAMPGPSRIDDSLIVSNDRCAPDAKPGPSRIYDSSFSSAPVVKKTKRKITFSPSIEVCHIDDNRQLDSVHFLPNVDIELVGFTLSSSICSTPVHSPHVVPVDQKSGPSRGLSDDDIERHLAVWEKTIGTNAGSDLDEDSNEDDTQGIDFTLRRRRASEYPAVVADHLPAELINKLDELDARDDLTLCEAVVGEDTDLLDFEWLADRESFTGQREIFTGQAGPTFNTEGMSALEIFEKIWDQSVIDLIVSETNKYACEMIPSASQYARIQRWSNMTVRDLWTFFAVIMLQSLIPITVEQQFWYPSLPYLKIGNFQNIMSFKQFVLIKKCLHFVDNSSQPKVRKIQKIMPIVDHLNQKFSSLYLPEQTIAIDESLLLWKGRLSFVQLIANKAASVGIKSYELCESRTGYLWKFILYAGKDANKNNIDESHNNLQNSGEPEEANEAGQESYYEPEGATSQIVYNLVRPLLNKGHSLVMDNFYNSPLLSRTLKRQKTDTMGTLRLNRKFLPESLRTKSKKNMRTGEIVFSQTKDLTVTVWNDTNVVTLISTYHPVEVGGKEKYGTYKYKPQVVLDYNLSMGGVDKKDQMLKEFPVERTKNPTWYKKVFRRLLNVSIYNAFVIYNHGKNNMKQREFRTILADQILKKHNSIAVLRPPPVPVQGTGHFPEKGVRNRARCKWCARRKVSTRTAWQCDTCGVSLCIVGCFRDFHLNQNT